MKLCSYVSCVTEPSDTTVVCPPIWRNMFVANSKVTPISTHMYLSSRKKQICTCSSGGHIRFSEVNTKLLKVLRHLEVESDYQWKVKLIDTDLVFISLLWLAYCLSFCVNCSWYWSSVSNVDNSFQRRRILHILKWALHATSYIKALIILLQFFVWRCLTHHIASEMTLLALNCDL